MKLEESYWSVRHRIESAATACGRDPQEITLIVVTKTHPIETIEKLYALGQRDFGESYAQELVIKAQEGARRGWNPIRWHFIGHLQTNKVKTITPWIHAVHTVDSERLALELAKRWKDRPSPLPIFMEVNIDAEPSKSGLTKDEVPALTSRLQNIPELRLCGLMCIPAFDRPAEQTRQSFSALRHLGQSLPPSATALSMGMSDDFDLAITEGATHVRVGTAILGDRPRPG